MYIKIDLTFMAEGDRIGKSVVMKGGRFPGFCHFLKSPFQARDLQGQFLE